MKATTIAAAAAAALAIETFGARQPAPAPNQTNLISHRGESIDAPENTLPAFETAVSRGFGFECDVYLSKDKRVFTFHDRNLKRTTAGANTNLCSEVDWEGTISKLDVGGWGKWKGSKFSGTRPALLEEVLKLARDGRYIYVEIKTGPEIVPYVKKVFDAQKNATPANVLFIAFSKEACKALKEQMPEYKVYWLTSSKLAKKDDSGKVEYVPITADFIIENVRYCKADGVDCHYASDVVTRKLVKEVKAAGLEFHVWTVDRLDLALQALSRGVQTVTTNRAKGLMEDYAKKLEKAAARKAKREAAKQQKASAQAEAAK